MTILRKCWKGICDILSKIVCWIERLKDQYYVDKTYGELVYELQTFEISKNAYHKIVFCPDDEERKEKFHKVEKELMLMATRINKDCQFLYFFYQEYLTIEQVANLNYATKEIEPFLLSSEE